MFWPFSVVDGATGVCTQLHEFAIQKLQDVGTKMGVSQALLLIPYIQAQRRRWSDGGIGTPWLLAKDSAESEGSQ